MARPRNIRLKVLKAVDARKHRFPVLRILAQMFTLGVLVAVPLSGLAQVDFWRGNHRLLFKDVPLKHALAGVIIGIAAMYVVTFLSNVVAGRLFCGWGCPVGQVSRFGERVETPGLKGAAKLRARVWGALYSGVFVVSVFAWWCDPRVLWMGSATELAVAWGVIAFGTAGAYLHGRYWRWEFCKRVCPIGIYYSFVAPASYFGIYFRNQRETCIECDACDNVCPVDLHPRELAKPLADRPGLSVAEAPGFNHCLECGDCVRACERMIELRTPDEFPKGVPLHMGYFGGPQAIGKDDVPGDAAQADDDADIATEPAEAEEPAAT